MATNFNSRAPELASTNRNWGVDSIRLLTRQILSGMNGQLTPQEKQRILRETDETLFSWFSGPANGNVGAYKNALFLQGSCNRPSEKR